MTTSRTQAKAEKGGPYAPASEELAYRKPRPGNKAELLARIRQNLAPLSPNRMEHRERDNDVRDETD